MPQTRPPLNRGSFDGLPVIQRRILELAYSAATPGKDVDGIILRNLKHELGGVCDEELDNAVSTLTQVGLLTNS